MITFEQLKEGAATLVDEAAKTTGSLMQKGKKQVDQLALENKLAKAQRQLGALIYSLYKNGERNNALVERYIQSVDAIEQEINALDHAPTATQMQLTQEEDTMVTCCTQCGAEVNPHAIFCPGCGNKLQ